MKKKIDIGKLATWGGLALTFIAGALQNFASQRATDKKLEELVEKKLQNR